MFHAGGRVAFVVGLAIGLWAGEVRADRKAEGAVVALVKRHVAAMSKGSSRDFLTTLAPSALVVHPWGRVYRLPVDGCRDCDDPSTILTGHLPAKVRLRPGKLIVATDAAHGVAWFAGPVTASVTERSSDGAGGETSSTRSAPVRIVGIAVAEGEGGWKIAAVTYGMPIPDSNLHAFTDHEPGAWKRPVPVQSGEAAITRAVAAWVPGAIAAARTTGPTAVASGTAPAQFATGEAIGKVVGAWDRLDAGLVRVDARTYAGGALGFVTGELAYPLPPIAGVTDAGALHVAFAAVVVPEAAGWRWAALNLTPVSIPP